MEIDSMHYCSAIYSNGSHKWTVDSDGTRDCLNCGGRVVYVSPHKKEMLTLVEGKPGEDDGEPGAIEDIVKRLDDLTKRSEQLTQQYEMLVKHFEFDSKRLARAESQIAVMLNHVRRFEDA